MGTNIVVFAGSGASKAVSPDDYPTTREFFERLPQEVTRDGLFQLLLEFIRGTPKKDAPIDIEMVLWALEDLRLFVEAVLSSTRIGGWFLEEDRMSRALGGQPWNFGNVKQVAHVVGPRIDVLASAINRQVYALYGQLPPLELLEETWLPLLRRLLRTDHRIELVTTNYDLVIESALDAVDEPLRDRVDTGWRGSVLRTLEPTLWDAGQRDRRGLLTKLHGSVNWTRDGDKIFISDPTYKGSHTRHAIIYPGFKGQPSDSIFQTLHSHFGRVLQDASAALFIGFAFRDEYINALCDRFLQHNARIVVLNPVPEFPALTGEAAVVRIAKEFTKETAEEAADALLDIARTKATD